MVERIDEYNAEIESIEAIKADILNKVRPLLNDSRLQNIFENILENNDKPARIISETQMQLAHLVPDREVMQEIMAILFKYGSKMIR